MPNAPQVLRPKIFFSLNATLLAAYLLTCGTGRIFAQTKTQLPAPPFTEAKPIATQTEPNQTQPVQSQPTPLTALPDSPRPAASSPSPSQPEAPCAYPPCFQATNWYVRFMNGPQVTPLTPKQKGWLAARNFIDPFNAITILGEGAIYIGANSHSDYGPGMPGFSKYVGVSFTQDLTGEFFNTFLIPSVAHQDPHYHRMPHASYPRRLAHAVTQVLWTQGDNGKGMLNYSNLLGYAIDDEISNLYVPGRETNASATAQRYGIALATAPIGNFITEFLPDVARHIHVEIVVVQRIINQVAKTDQ